MGGQSEPASTSSLYELRIHYTFLMLGGENLTSNIFQHVEITPDLRFSVHEFKFYWDTANLVIYELSMAAFSVLG